MYCAGTCLLRTWAVVAFGQTGRELPVLKSWQPRRRQVKTVEGSVDLKVPAGTQPGTTLVMAKRGVPRLGSSNVRGDHQVCAAEDLP